MGKRQWRIRDAFQHKGGAEKHWIPGLFLYPFTASTTPMSMPVRRRVSFSISIAIFALIVVLGALYFINVALLYQEERQADEHQSMFLAQGLARTAALRAGSALRVVDFGLIEQRGKYLQRDSQIAQSISRFASALKEASPTVSITDASGQIIFSSAPEAYRLNVASHPLFQQQAREFEKDQLLITGPFMGSLRDHDIVVATRPIVRDGKFAGIIFAALEPNYLFASLNDIALGSTSVAQLAYGLNGEVIAANDSAQWKAGLSLGTALGMEPESAAGVRYTQGDPSGHAAAWARVSGFPLLAISRVEDTPSEDWQAWRRNLIFGLILFPLTLGLVALARYSHTQSIRTREQELVYRTLFHDSGVIQLLIDPQTQRVVHANQAAQDFYRRSLESLRLCTMADLGDAPAQKEGSPGMRQFSQITADGERRTVEATIDMISLRGQSLVHYAMHDVTERQMLALQLRRSEALYRTLFATVPNGLLVVDDQGNIRNINPTALRLLGGNAQAIRNNSSKLFDPQGMQLTRDELPSRIALHEDMEGRLLKSEDPNGQTQWLSVHSRKLPGVPGEPQGAVVSFSDVSRLVELEQANRVGGLVFNASPEGIAVLGPDFHIIQANPALIELLGLTSEQLLGHLPFELAQGRYALRRQFAFLMRELRAHGQWTGELFWTQDRAGKPRVLEAQVVAIRNGTSESITGFVALLADITARKELDAVNWHRANVDQLTGLPNRLHLLDQLTVTLAHGKAGKTTTILFLDLNGFKTVNDTYGHDAGDTVLVQAGIRFQGVLRAGDTVSRWGGDEFIVLLPSANRYDGHRIAERLVDVLKAPMSVYGRPVHVGTSIGVAEALPGETDGLALIKRADMALYEAKRQARPPRIVIFGEEASATA